MHVACLRTEWQVSQRDERKCNRFGLSRRGLETASKVPPNEIPLTLSLASYVPPVSCPWGRGKMGYVCTFEKHPSSQKIIGFVA